ncbi:hypothetical protein BD410DRAFT_785477 [Rickenella mellea]|uniref:DAGKc domain-containing protein n=1 Tax=Rickenella mellea TaxID=50990 RepID=A0A4Y7QBW9_9AGAM|nr:hypothetical protein BD410DRAFT_785477 [Rickenella mellea]
MGEQVGPESNRVLSIVVDGKATTLTFVPTSGSITVTSGKKRSSQLTARDVLWTEVEEGKVEFSCVLRDSKRRGSLVCLEGTLGTDDKGSASQWCEDVLQAAYAGVKRRPRFNIVINPHGGQGKARSIWTKKVEPIFKAARCTYDVIITEYSKHACEIAKNMKLDCYDAVVILSGDGLIHEIINGFAEHEDSKKAFAIPIAPIPTGSGNGTSINILGLEDGFDVHIASLNALKGKPMKADVSALTQGGKRVLSYMTQAVGLMAELDVGTENLRWMGDTRFMVGFLRGLIYMNPCPITVSMKVADQDKPRMAAALRASRPADLEDQAKSASEPNGIYQNGHTDAPPTPSFGGEIDEDGWLTFDKPFLFLYAGKGPYVGRDLMQFPVSLASDGLIDIVLQELTSRAELLRAIDGGEKGTPYWMNSSHYFKAHAYRVAPHSDKGLLTVDGESYPFEPYEVEVLPGLATFLSPTGRYASDFDFGKDRLPVQVETKPIEKSKEAEGSGPFHDLFRCCFP